jgi:segregation and condensation protein A
VAAQLSAMEDGMLARFARRGVEEQLRELMMDAEEQSPLTNLTLTSLAVAFQKALVNYSARGQVANHVVFAVPYNIADQKALVAASVALAGRITFLDLVTQCVDRLQVVYTFMAILEMLNEHAIALVLGDGANEFYLERMSLSAIPANEA